MPVQRSKRRAQRSVGDKTVEVLLSPDDKSTNHMARRKCAGMISTDEDRPRSSGIALIAGLGPEGSIFSRDAENIAGAVKAKGWDTVLCINPQAKKDDIHAAFMTLHEKAWPGCSCMLYFGAHADADADGQFSILPVE